MDADTEGANRDGEPDEELLQESLLGPLRALTAAERVRQSAKKAQMVVASDTVDPKTGARKIVVRKG